MRFSKVVYLTLAAALAIGALWVSSASAVVEFSRYEVILERMPFGEPPAEPEPPPGPPPAPPPPPFERSFARNIRLCFLREHGKSIRVGFLDVGTKPQKNYLLNVGETSDDGIEVKDADFEEEKVLLAKEDQEYWVSMTGKAGSQAGGRSVAVPKSVRSRRTSGRRTSRSLNLAERIRRRRETVRHRVVKPPKLSGEALKIREGKPALPIPLTKEQDAQLVKEGVLPPSED